MRQQIQETLRQMEQQKGLRVVFACESGSRAWGFPSPDSDYDVRFAYVHPTAWYLGIEEQPEFIEFPKDEILDITGYDIRKLLRLFRASNAKIFEWIQSPVVYRQEDAFLSGLRSLAPAYFSPRAGLHHYLGLTRNTLENDLQAPQVKLKKYFYALRPVLAALWIMERNECPPMVFHCLREMVSDGEINRRIDDLLARKVVADESHSITPDPVLHRFIAESMERCRVHAQQLEPRQTSAASLNELFRNTIGII